MSITILKHDYWLNHEYHRLNVMDYVERFCGSEALEKLLLELGSDRNKAFFLFMFKTGGRVNEVLNLKAENFSVVDDFLVVRNMKLEKRWRKDKQTGETKTIQAERKPFPISLSERLTDDMLVYLEDKRGLLFPNPYRTEYGYALTSNWAYKLIVKTSASLLPSLRRKLGLDVPFKDKYGHVIANEIHLLEPLV